MSTSLKKLGAITLFVEDVQKSKLFYQDNFDVKLVYEDEQSAAFDFGDTIVKSARASRSP